MTYTAEQYRTVLQEIINILQEPKLQKNMMAMLADSPAIDSVMKAYLTIHA